MTSWSESAGSNSLGRKILVTTAIGAFTFVGSEILGGPLHASLIDQLIFTLLIGSTTFLTQYLIDFAGQLSTLGDQQKRNFQDARQIDDQRFSTLSEATRLHELLEGSVVGKKPLVGLIEIPKGVDLTEHRLITDLARSQIRHLSDLFKALTHLNDVFYDGEDRQLLIDLTTGCRLSIDSTSLATVDAGGETGFEGGFWRSDLGGRYLNLQRDAVTRGVAIRRIFIFEESVPAQHEDFDKIIQLQRDAGVEVRVLDPLTIPESFSISDYIVFDRTVSYETAPATRLKAKDRATPALLTTRLVLERRRVEARANQFSELWKAAYEIP